VYEKSPLLARIRNRYSSMEEVPTSSHYERITAVAAFEHICELPGVVARCGLHLEPAGTLRVAIPAEGTFLWTLGWRLTTGPEFRRKHGLDYAVLMRHEHVNTAAEIEAVLRYFFATVDCSVFGISRALSFYHAYVCSSPIPDRCQASAAAPAIP
jgi:hypothetical protein